MSTKSVTTRRTAKAPLTGKALRRASQAATKQASRTAFQSVEELLVVKDGWLVKVDKAGKVRKRVRKIQLPAE